MNFKETKSKILSSIKYIIDKEINSTKANIYLCKDESFFISKHQVCDGIFDCKSGMDEADCFLSSNRFFCQQDQSFISSNSVCDFSTNCLDESDERICGFSFQKNILI